MTNGRVEVITSVERWRRWSSAEKQRLVAATLEPGASVSAIARDAGIHPGQLYGWRRQLRAQPRIDFAPVQVMAEPAPESAGIGAIEIELATDIRPASPRPIIPIPSAWFRRKVRQLWVGG
jgi:transposase